MQDCEEQLANLADRAHVALASRATIALTAVFRALQLPPNSEVLMPVTLCANPAYAVRWAGLRPLFADVSPTTFNLDLASAERVVGPQTKVLLAVPLFGHPFDVLELTQFAERHGLIIIEDAAQAVGLHYADRPIGSLGVCTVYSFGRGKIADAGGGAALLSDDASLMARARLELASMPSGSLDLAERAASIIQSLDKLPAELESRTKMADLYRRMLNLPGITHPLVPAGKPLWKYSVLLPARTERDRVTRALVASGVEATNLYPPLFRFFPEVRNSDSRHYPVAQDIFSRIVNLPLYPPSPNLAEIVAQTFAA